MRHGAKPLVKSAAASTESRREFERFGREGDGNAGGSRRIPIGRPRTENMASIATLRLPQESPSFPLPRRGTENGPDRKTKPARFRGPIENSPIATGSNCALCFGRRLGRGWDDYLGLLTSCLAVTYGG